MKPLVSTKSKSSRGYAGRTLLIILLGRVVLYLLHLTILFLFFALLPTFAAWLAERGANRYTWMTVRGFNFAGATPFLLDL
ncbi:MAG: Acyl-coenzyme A synthetases/AMP-(Fatty) acid ligase [Rhodospirillaceae bacterium]|nr:MAG: Acyl-coenzyme A synthetases/AMP-(Fatty) acid ligase [Rhodospirillaceae bacterium]